MTNGENLSQGKTPHQVNLRSPLSRKSRGYKYEESYHYPGYSKLPIYDWTFASIPNWTWSCSSILFFVARIFNLWLTPLHESQYVTNSSNLNDCCWLQSSLLHKQWRSGSTLLQNPMAHKGSSFTESIWILGLCICMWWFLKYSFYMTRVVRIETLIK